ncbi:MAG: RteC domain-containing protein [Bacteroidia bacterium]
MEQYEQLKLQLCAQVTQISEDIFIPCQLAAALIPICFEALENLRILVNKDSFKTLKDEIYFFRHLKPEMFSKLIFHIVLYNIESAKPAGSEKSLKKYYNIQLKKINEFRDENIGFYKYYRSESIFLDEKYFTRSKSNLHLVLDHNVFNYDAKFNTSHDQKVAQILANDQLTIYLNNQLNKLERNLFADPSIDIPHNHQLKWTEKKNSLVELIYALHASGALNDGKADVKEIASFFESHFKIKLGNFYRDYHDLKYRKINQTKFIDSLKKNLSSRMNMPDEN